MIDVVMADCADCPSVHPLGRRQYTRSPLSQSPGTTLCPECNSPSYETELRNYEVVVQDD